MKVFYLIILLHSIIIFSKCGQKAAKNEQVESGVLNSDERSQAEKSDGKQAVFSDEEKDDDGIKSINSIETIPVNSFEIDTSDIKDKNLFSGNLFSYFDEETEMTHLAFLSGNKWKSFVSPFPSPDINKNNITKAEFVDLDEKGMREILIRGEWCFYGSGGGTCEGGSAIFSIEGSPKQLFLSLDYCSQEGFGSVSDSTIKNSFCEVKRKIKIQNRKIHVPNLSLNSDTCCEVSQLAQGIYSLKDGRIVKER